MIKSITARFHDAGIEFPDREARWFVKHFENAIELENAVTRRVGGEPVSRIFGEAEFWSLKFKIGPHTLDPRPDTETLVRIALEHLQKKFHVKQKTAEILDLGSGSGCIIISLLHEMPNATGIATDLSPEALEIVLHNANSLGVEASWFDGGDARGQLAASGSGGRLQVAQGNWGDALGPEFDGRFDLVVSNPPYIRSDVIPNLDPEVRNHDPILALDGGEDGLQAYKIIFSDLERLLKPTGIALLEIGYDQETAIQRLAEKYRIRIETIHPDLAGRPRVVEITRGDK